MAFSPESQSVPTAPAELRECLEAVGGRFDRHGALGMLLVEAPVLHQIEQTHGDGARRRALAALGSLVTEIGRERLDVDDLVVSGETGRNEILVLLFREHRDGRFYRQELPGLDQSVRQEMGRRGAKVFYPYLRTVPPIGTGLAVVLRNPKLGTESQICSAIEEARADAELNRRIQARRRRRQIVELVLDRRVTSVYEPIVDVATRTVFGYEALARGPVGSDQHSAMSLFGVAEEEGLLYELDGLCRASGLEGAIDFPSGTKLFLNIRPTTIHDPNFRAERLIETLARCQLGPSDVVFEISEQEGIANMDDFLEMRDYYRGLGFQIALDDTGAGYAGLEALLELSPDFIKVDRACVSGIDQDPVRQDMLAALQSMAGRTGARIIGEGLDRLEELETLGDLGIEFGQGWLFGKPTPLRARG
jgi:EAL domain-containing protein (putative c-di-GMP-specific phosphodiesterase class I)